MCPGDSCVLIVRKKKGNEFLIMMEGFYHMANWRNLPG